MKSRIELLNHLIKLDRDLKDIQDELSQYPWDIDEPLVTITKSDFRKIAQYYLNDKISVVDLENWANAIECREDIDFEVGQIKEYIFELANPITNGKISKQRIERMISFL